MTENPWITEASKTISPLKVRMSSLALKVRSDQYEFFLRTIKPNKNSFVLDDGVISNEILQDANFFEKIYKYPAMITAATIEDHKKLQKLYPDIKVVKIEPNNKLPFKDKQFDVAVSWATLEHVGDYKKQEFFINELLRVSNKTFLTTPYRGCIYEPHCELFFVHWLPLPLFRKICKMKGNNFCSEESNLNPLYIKNIKKMNLIKQVRIKVYKMFNLLPSHLLIYAT